MSSLVYNIYYQIFYFMSIYMICTAHLLLALT
nr:MAG TPA: hypothetical protein [Caudoviricetes sp.]DAP12083.1 MAG TPA: hypothetical protein [Caudoviricetes sp.]DAP52077.1 MAG TPA: hypothetical protein [Caudoviricetes sp.]